METEQVIFSIADDSKTFGGILVNDKYIICGCCGGVFEVTDADVTIIRRLSWIDISESIKGE